MLSQPDAPDVQPQGALCARHPTDPATAVCSRCGSYACRLCFRQGADGLSYCSQCVSKVTVLAPRGERFLANLVDMILFLVPAGGGLLLGFIVAKAFGSNTGGSVIMVLSALASVGVLGYQLYRAVQTGQTLGKRMAGIRVVRSDGSPVSFGRLFFLRNLSPVVINLSLGPFGLFGLFGLVDALFIFGKHRRCIHDWLADTKVVSVSAPERMG